VSTFLTLLGEGLLKVEREGLLKFTRVRCCSPLPFHQRTVVPPSSPILRYTAAVTICAAHQKWKDDELDEGPLRKCGAKVGKWLLNSRWEKAKTELTATGFPFQKVTALLQQQSELERELETELEQELAINNNNKKQQHLVTPSVLDGDVSTIEMAIEKASRPTALSYAEIVHHLARLSI
jgi:hypothetical protein